MHNTPQWIVTKRVPRANGKTDKIPVMWRTAAVGVDAHDPANWTTYQQARDSAQMLGVEFGIGFVFTNNDPYFFIDLDASLTDGQPSALALEALALFPGAYVEVSQSGKGLHIIGSYTRGEGFAHGCRNDALHIELYTFKRFADITGAQAIGNTDTDHTAALRTWAGKYHPAPVPLPPNAPAEWTTGPCPEWRGPTDDHELVERARRSRSTAAIFAGKATFADLWEANIPVLAASYPADPNSHDPYNASAADTALASHLMFWTGKDCDRTERIMRRSSLARAKWDERDDYLRERVILYALRRSRDVLQDKPPEPPRPPVEVQAPTAAPATSQAAPAAPAPAGGNTLLGAAQQAALFKGCVYVIDQHRALVPNGHLLKPDQFKALYGGYSFVMDAGNTRTSRNAWEAFTESQIVRPPVADGTTFRPDLPPAALAEQNGRKLVNTYWPIDVPRKAGDAGPFLDHLRRILPNERDQEILLSYMCAVVQHKGVKFQWAPLLQGAEGNGKTLFTRCVAQAVGQRYTHMPPANELTEKFNAWLFGNIFIGVEDIYVPEQKREVVEVLKPMITGDFAAMRRMNTDQVMHNMVCNFIFNSNHRDAVAKTRNDRRFCVMFTAQQTADDLVRDGMVGDYFPRLYDWLKADGYAIVSDLLHTRPIRDEYNPATGCQRAPETSTTEAAIREGMGRIEQEVLEAVSQERPGFRGGWISSVMLTSLLKDAGARLTHNKRREMLQSLGYDWHPGLPGGRVYNDVPPDGAKPRLFVTKDHPSRGLSGSAVAHAYSQAQNAPAVAPAPPVTLAVPAPPK